VVAAVRAPVDERAKRGAAPRSTGKGEAGFTLVELAIATVVLLVAVLLACELLAESGRLLHHSVRRARDPWPLLAAELLRNDLRGADPPQIPREDWEPRCCWSSWFHSELPLRVGDDSVEWSRSGDGYLTRTAGDIDRAYIQDVRSFRWRVQRGPVEVIEVWVSYRVSSPYLRQLAGSLPRTDPGEIVDLHLVEVARGGRPSDRW
jgi:hypothetical protein